MKLRSVKLRNPYARPGHASDSLLNEVAKRKASQSLFFGAAGLDTQSSMKLRSVKLRNICMVEPLTTLRAPQ